MGNEEGRELGSRTKEVTERKLSVLERVREQLKTNKDVFFAGEILTSPADGGWTETVDIIVAPQQPIYDIDKLNKFMDGLIVNIKPSTRDAAYPHKEGGINLGKLYFDEVLGIKKQEITTHITAYEPEAIQRAGITIGESHRTKEEELNRRTWVRVYPDANSAKIIAEYEQGVRDRRIEPNSTFEYLRHWIEPEQIKKMKKQQNPFTRIVGLLKRGV